MCVCIHVPPYARGGQRTTCKNWFSSSILWISGNTFRASGLESKCLYLLSHHLSLKHPKESFKLFQLWMLYPRRHPPLFFWDTISQWLRTHQVCSDGLPENPRGPPVSFSLALTVHHWSPLRCKSNSGPHELPTVYLPSPVRDLRK